MREKGLHTLELIVNQSNAYDCRMNEVDSKILDTAFSQIGSSVAWFVVLAVAWMIFMAVIVTGTLKQLRAYMKEALAAKKQAAATLWHIHEQQKKSARNAEIGHELVNPVLDVREG